ncbi:MAG: hypothetical protein QXH12_05715 [Candidatus Caldarchaeum sp.]
MSLPSTVVLAIAIYFGMPLIEQGQIEGILLIVLRILDALFTEYVVSLVFRNQFCQICGEQMKKVHGLYYCRRCRRIYDPRRVKEV